MWVEWTKLSQSPVRWSLHGDPSRELTLRALLTGLLLGAVLTPPNIYAGLKIHLRGPEDRLDVQHVHHRAERFVIVAAAGLVAGASMAGVGISLWQLLR